jgi:glycosyltransferase involved in cell wall biosynthesis
MEKSRITGLIVSRNEAHLIGDRLRELEFCDELIVIDVASTDGTARIAEARGARVIAHPFTRIAELVHPDVVHHVHNDLLVIPDPDEEMPPALVEHLAGLSESLAGDVGVLVVPRIFYFRGRPLRGTVWGGVGWKPLVARRSGSRFQPAVHHGVKPLPGHRIERLAWNGDNAVKHHWASGYREFIRKHVRYIRIEGPARALTGEITGVRATLKTPVRSFRECYVTRKGYLDGADGLLLSLMYAVYRTASDVQLVRELRRRQGR